MSNPYPQSIAFNLIANASNIRQGQNPAFTRTDFLSFYPQFTDKVDNGILDQFVAMANATVLQVRWHEMWQFAMCLFIAHMATLYMRTLAGTDPNAQQVINAAQVIGLQTSKSVGDLSVSYDFSAIAGDLEGWIGFKQTEYGIQFASFARMLGKAGMYIY